MSLKIQKILLTGAPLILSALLLTFAVTSLSGTAEAAVDPHGLGSLRPEKIHVAGSKKTNTYIEEGLISGGDQAIQDVIVKDIRRAKNPGYERIVIDLEGNRNGEPAELQRPPYYQVAVQPKEKRLTITVTGHPNLSFNTKKVLESLKKSTLIKKVTLLPKVEDNLWVFALSTHGKVPVEVFELTHPVRVILDLKLKKH